MTLAVKFTMQGLLIYAAMSLYALAFVAVICRARKIGVAIYAGGFAAALAAVIYRGIDTGHAPLSNLFEVTLFLAMLMFPLSLFSRRVLRIGDEAADMLIGVALLFAPGFVFEAAVRKLPPSLRTPIFVPHVAAYMVGYAIMAKAALVAAAQLVRGNVTGTPRLLTRERASYRLICLGFPPLTAGILLGALWAKLAWLDWWNWDPKELWSLATWLVFLGYFHFRYATRRRYPTANAVIAILGFAAILSTLLWASLSKLFTGLHGYA
ncbi:MAG: cytochrome c biogenesis protein [Planctomycetota bacterium]